MTATKPTKLAPTADPRCGTRAGYQAHYRRGEAACRQCKLANRAVSREATRRHRSTLEGREAAREANREASRRRRATLEGREANREAKRHRRDALRSRTAEQADADFRAKWPDGRPCRSCGEVLPAEAFARNWTEVDGRERRCDRNGCRNRDHRIKQLARVADHRGFPKGRCAYCLTGPVEHIDHFYPVSKGGPDHIDNMVPSCSTDNLAKSDRDPFEYLAQHHPDRLEFFRALFPQEVS